MQAAVGAGRFTCQSGSFSALHTVGEALKGGYLLAAVALQCGIAASPAHSYFDRLGAMLNRLLDGDIHRSHGPRYHNEG